MATKVTKKKSVPAKKQAKEIVLEEDALGAVILDFLKEEGFVILRMDYDVGVKGFWRQIVVPANFDLDELHQLIQCAFGWECEHPYSFIQGEQSYTLEECMQGHDKPTNDTFVFELFEKKGDKATYEYDFGDDNIVKLTCKGLTHKLMESDFGSEGQDAIEDSSGFGFIPGIVKLLTKGKDTPAARECRAWLGESFGKNPESVLKAPTAKEICERTILLWNKLLLAEVDALDDE